MKRWHTYTAPSYFTWAEGKERAKQQGPGKRPVETETVEGYLVVEFEPGGPEVPAVSGTEGGRR